MNRHQRFSCLIAIALHVVPLTMIWMKWESARLYSASSSVGQVIPIRLELTESPGALQPVQAYSFPPLIEKGARLSSQSGPDIGTPSENLSAAQDAFPPVYLTANVLDLRPRPKSAVIIPFPDVPLEAERVEGILVLYIDSEGNVDRIEVQNSNLPPLLERVAMSSFMQAKMQPGMKEGKAVRSQMKVLVEFEAHNAY